VLAHRLEPTVNAVMLQIEVVSQTLAVLERPVKIVGEPPTAVVPTSELIGAWVVKISYSDQTNSIALSFRFILCSCLSDAKLRNASSGSEKLFEDCPGSAPLAANNEIGGM
jgi:hypothetical protein